MKGFIFYLKSRMYVWYQRTYKMVTGHYPPHVEAQLQKARRQFFGRLPKQ